MLFKQKSIIPSVREQKNLKLACQCKSTIVLLSGTHLGNLMQMVHCVHKHNKLAFADLELIGGFKADNVGIQLLKNMYHLDGIFTTNISAVRFAKNVGLKVCYRFFLIDSRSLKRTSNILKTHKSDFDAIEILPAVCGFAEIEVLNRLIGNNYYIAGGFVRSNELIEKAFSSGISAVTTSDITLWK
ncbi:glycerol-3-phosphate responsive antiterminator [Liquorilactobacillus nagelii]|uniref:glycerol-3-phosphate responsive antiterminator n=1 Tax=Liquorilactobacillus nagelii TaxID=82688 RepID=UPI0039EAA4B6